MVNKPLVLSEFSVVLSLGLFGGPFGTLGDLLRHFSCSDLEGRNPELSRKLHGPSSQGTSSKEEGPFLGLVCVAAASGATSIVGQ